MPHSGQRVFATCTSASGKKLRSVRISPLRHRPALPAHFCFKTWTSSLLLFTTSIMANHVDSPVYSDAFEQRIRERELLRSMPLETIPDLATKQPQGTIPNTPLAVSTISFCLGSVFAVGFSVFLGGGLSFWFATYQLAFFVASWSAFHWGEFAVTAGWNREKVSVDCMCFLSRSRD